MADQRDDKFIDAGNAESEQYEPDDEVKEEFAEAARLGSGAQILRRELEERHDTSPEVSGGDVDADWENAAVGEEAVGGSTPTPDQDIVEELGEAVGLTYQDDEPLHTTEKVEQRDRRRWELDPASSEDYQDRVNREGE